MGPTWSSGTRAALAPHVLNTEEVPVPQRIRDIMTKNPVTIQANASVLEAAQAMKTANIGDVIVLKEGNGEICGVVTDRDIVVRAIAEGKEASKTRVLDVCSDKVHTISPDEDVDEVIRVMRRYKVRRIPVIENQKAVGIVSLADLAASRDPGSLLGEISAAPPNR
jgi:CBS domain-containing protein